jgi:hypothetical protein
MDTRRRDWTITLTNAVVLTEPPNSQMVGKPEAITSRPRLGNRQIGETSPLHSLTAQRCLPGPVVGVLRVELELDERDG